ncbi:MAG: hypothetical protein JXN60_07465 [Lentisphaerae bacterium]|nr:hypothetical protein [Lentisphaerota bacterium]
MNNGTNKTNRLRIISTAILPFICSMLILSVHGQDAVEITTTWDSGQCGWECDANAILSNPGGYLNAQFAAQSTPSPRSTIIMTEIGDGILVTNIEFTFRAFNEKPSSLWLQAHSFRSGLTWYKPLHVTAVDEPALFSIPVNFSSGWTIGPCKTANKFVKDMRCIDRIGIYILRGGNCGAQNFGIDDFKILGITTSDADKDDMPDAWEITHGLDMGDENDAARDNDNDGMNNRAEFIAGTDPNNAASVFDLGIAEKTSTEQATTGLKARLRWNSAPNRSYSVLRTTDLATGFQILESGIASTPPENVYDDVTATNNGPYYYRIRIEPIFGSSGNP